MPDIILLQEGLQLFLLVLTRIGALISTAPFWSGKVIPMQVKIYLTILTSAALLPLVWELVPSVSTGSPFYILMVIRETLLGLILGLASVLLFNAIQVAGQIIDTQMGFGMVNVLDPQSGTQIPMMGNFYYLIALLLFILSDGHHYLLTAVTRSFILVPPGTITSFPTHVWQDVTGLLAQILVFALQIALPVAGVLFLTDIALGIIARTVPQMNVFVLGIPIKILAGIFTIFFVLPLYAVSLRFLFRQIFATIDLLLRACS